MGKVQFSKAGTSAVSKYNRIFDEALKRSIVERFDAKLLTIKEICELYEVTRTSVYKWIDRYSKSRKSGTIQVVQMESDVYKLKALNQHVATLEQVVGRKQMEIDYLEKLLEIASQELGIDLKKKFDSPPWTGSVNMPPNIPTH
jgi:transposase